MANDFSGLIIPILAQGLEVLRADAIATRLVNTSYSQDAIKKGSVIQIPSHRNATAFDVTPSSTPLAGADTTVGMINLPISYWKGASLTLTAADYQAFDRGLIAPSVRACAIAIADAIHASVIAQYTSFYGAVGTAGTTPFGGATPSQQDAVNVLKLLKQQLAPNTGRQIMLDPTAAAAAKMVPAFNNQQYAANSAVGLTGAMGTQLNMNWYEVSTVPTHTAGTGSGYLTNNGAGVAAGSTTIPVDTGTGTLVKGDLLTFAGHTQTYTVTANYAGGAGNITISPALRVLVADNVAITKVATHTVNLAFHRDAIAFASRKELASQVPGVIFESMVDDDPVQGSGIALNIEFSRQTKQDLMLMTCQWGVIVQRPEFGVRLLG